MFELLDQAADELVTQRIDPVDVLSRVGSALFFRFLADRQIVTAADLPEIHADLKDTTNAFANAEFAWATSRWLDETFNGDLLPLTRRGSRHFFVEIGTKTEQAAFHHLSARARARTAATAGGAYQLRLQWDGFDFAQVPVGLLSQVYEAYSAASAPDGELLVRYLQLFAHSSVWRHYALLTATKIGAERRMIYKQVFHNCPFVPLQQHRRILALSKQLLNEDRRVFLLIDRFLASVYGLDHLDCEVIRDTLDERLIKNRSGSLLKFGALLD